MSHLHRTNTRRAFLGMLAGSALAGIATRARASRPRIQAGVCAPPSDFALAEAQGFDYFEPPAAAIAAMSAEEFAGFKAQVLASPLRCRCSNSLIRTLRVVGDDVSLPRLADYLDLCLPRCRQLGGEIVVWGSARSRNVAAGYPRERAWKQMVEFLRMAGDKARAAQLLIAIEPLSHPESNIINTAAEALRLVRDVHHPRVRMIVDYYHLCVENEDPEIILRARKEIVHFHFANPQGRRWPKTAPEDPGYARFFALLQEIKYRGGISIEGRGSLAADGRASLAFLRQELSAIE
jgi:sugar phosphate isomerase/epimerase